MRDRKNSRLTNELIHEILPYSEEVIPGTDTKLIAERCSHYVQRTAFSRHCYHLVKREPLRKDDINDIDGASVFLLLLPCFLPCPVPAEGIINRSLEREISMPPVDAV